MKITYFDRHKEMDSKIQKMIIESIKELSFLEANTRKIENYLYGAFDGYDYSEVVINSEEYKKVSEENPELGSEIKEIFNTIKKYTRIEPLQTT